LAPLVLADQPAAGTPADQPSKTAAADASSGDAKPTGDAKPAADAKPTGDAKPAGDTKAATAEFDKIFAEFKQVLAKLRSLQGKYQLAADAERPVIEAEFNTQVALGKEIAPRLLAAAKAAYLASPNANASITRFLVQNVAESDQNDNYAAAFDMAKLLVDHGCKEPALYNFAGIAAFGSNHFDLAKEWLEEASHSKVLGDVGKADLKAVDEYQELWPTEEKIRETEAQADDLPRVLLKTSKGDVVIELFENEAPIATANFISLVEKHFYDGVPFHRVIAGFMAQGGDPTGTGRGGPGYTIPDECQQENARSHFGGSMSMAKTAEPDTGGSQFFLTFRPTPHLNGKHTVFGRVIEGMDVAATLERIDPEKPGPAPDKIITATVLRKRNHPYEPTKSHETN
jgi:cyclophilin family peptidyl-prolyl cis-trans isomerase